ncbi:formimidoylglutamase [Streptomyces xanthii]|uniref:Formimidoylglutamase n=1 Tax=Streptomyces xanthii TaxID=2768069 RepID=A0A7H1BH82_9ACTN|nr:formimidoylglutamase [Streptomyces xanthii]QNS08087.1 formimidoylglutamase [Streptomyces xanthii]
MSTYPEAAPAVAVVPARPWSGRDDGPGAEHLRWHHAVELDAELTEPGDLAFVGFACDEGVRRNKGRQGAAQGPAALRQALASMALPKPLRAFDAGDVSVDGTADDALETGQQRLGSAVAHLVDRGHRVVVLGGGHEVAFGTYSGLEQTRAVRAGGRLGVLNLDAHFDLRDDVRPSSGTPFLQMAQSEARHGRDLNYWVLGISQAGNTQALFRTAQSLGVRYLPDTECGVLDATRVDAFVDAFLASCELVHLTIDLDVLPAAVAPGVSAPAAYGVPMEVVERVCARVARSGKLVVVDVAELNPEFDVDGRTARAAARLVHRTATTWA